MSIKLIIGVLCGLLICGCATTQKNAAGSLEQLQSKVSDLEKEISDRDEKIRELESQLTDIGRSVDQDDAVDITKVTPRKIQTALQNAGYYKGVVDGKIGKKTQLAIKSFQRAKGLKADGVVGKKTWARLEKYL
jgi:murein L,D-transpeptidase YcbB/YkuD